MDENPTTRADDHSAQEADEAAERAALQDLDITDEQGQSIKGGVPKQPDSPRPLA